MQIDVQREREPCEEQAEQCFPEHGMDVGVVVVVDDERVCVERVAQAKLQKRGAEFQFRVWPKLQGKQKQPALNVFLQQWSLGNTTTERLSNR